jgi:hypothetical protein
MRSTPVRHGCEYNASPDGPVPPSPTWWTRNKPRLRRRKGRFRRFRGHVIARRAAGCRISVSNRRPVASRAQNLRAFLRAGSFRRRTPAPAPRPRPRGRRRSAATRGRPFSSPDGISNDLQAFTMEPRDTRRRARQISNDLQAPAMRWPGSARARRLANRRSASGLQAGASARDAEFWQTRGKSNSKPHR